MDSENTADAESENHRPKINGSRREGEKHPQKFHSIGGITVEKQRDPIRAQIKIAQNTQLDDETVTTTENTNLLCALWCGTVKIHEETVGALVFHKTRDGISLFLIIMALIIRWNNFYYI
jgi:hypothetical protein